tara:strand:+ start:337 stop:1449 length:1113 start_codon:yes stop_codon:yes gene_type:complete
MKLNDLKLILKKFYKDLIKSFKKTHPIILKSIKKFHNKYFTENLLTKNKNLLALSALTLFFIWIISYPFIPLNHSKDKFFEIKKGENFSQITKKLVELDILSDSLRFKILAKIINKTESIKSGHYLLEKNTSPYNLLTLLDNGDGILYSVTFVEGTTFKESLQELKKNNLLINKVASDSIQNIKKILGIDHEYLEGLFFPDTYYFYKGTLDVDILKQSYSLMMKKLTRAWDNKTPGLPYKNKYEALIVASIIEKELGDRNEASTIAGVFVNRLKVGMPLQSDPTVIYGMQGLFKGNLSKQDLLRDTPFNTYTRNGLPPSPICLPGFDTIEATLNPAETNAFYFVAKGDNKTHHFSKTLKEHNEAIRKYQK